MFTVLFQLSVCEILEVAVFNQREWNPSNKAQHLWGQAGAAGQCVLAILYQVNQFRVNTIAYYYILSYIIYYKI